MGETVIYTLNTTVPDSCTNIQIMLSYLFNITYIIHFEKLKLPIVTIN